MWERAKGFFGTLGSWGRTIARGIATRLYSAADVFTELGKAEIPIAHYPALEEVEEWKRVVSRAAKIEDVASSEFVPHELYLIPPPGEPMATNFQYQMHGYGRDIKTGRYSAFDMNILSERELTPGEMRERTADLYLAGGKYPRFSELRSVTPLSAHAMSGAL